MVSISRCCVVTIDRESSIAGGVIAGIGGFPHWDSQPRICSTSPADTTDRRRLTLAVGGMSCASCAGRVEKRLNQVDGVTATVNFATKSFSPPCSANWGQ